MGPPFAGRGARIKTFRFLILTAAAVLGLVCLGSGEASFPVVLRIVSSPLGQTFGNFGGPVAMGDADGDGRADLLVGAPYEDVGANSGQGRAYLFSGATGALLQILTLPVGQADARFGGSVAMGDADGDGRADLVIGAPFEDVGANGDQGRAYLFSGATGTLLHELDLPSTGKVGALFGMSVAMGDTDGDGHADLLVGAPYETVGANDYQGRAYLFSGATGDLLDEFDSLNPQAWGNFGWSVAMGDADGDGHADLLVGAPQESAGGSAYLFSGATSTLLQELVLPVSLPGAFFGGSVAMGDADGDGRADILVGAPYETVGANYGQGRGYLFSGVGGALTRELDLPVPQADAYFGYSVAMGDADGDGRADILVGAPYEDVGVNAGQGRAYLFTAMGAVIAFDSPIGEAMGAFGGSVAMGDADGDGRADLLVGAPYEDVGANADQGRAYLLSGATGTLLQNLDMPVGLADAHFGDSVAMGDADGDGRADLLVGAPSEDVGTNIAQGRAYLFSGATGAVLHELDLPVGQAYARFGSSVAMGDADGDGRADLLVGAPEEDVGTNIAQGRAYLFSGATGAVLHELDTPFGHDGALFGSSVAMGDADGDGRADLLVGASWQIVGTNLAQGRAYLFSGATGALLHTLDSPNPQAWAHFGNSLAMGDADGDGRADLLVGARRQDVGANTGQGRAYLFSGASGTLLQELDMPVGQANAKFGGSLAMGDADGDGRADLLVGAPEEDVGTNIAQGRAYLFSGATGPLVEELDLPAAHAGALFGNSVAMGDADGDGRADILVGAPWEDVGANTDQGRAYLFSGATGALLQRLDMAVGQFNAYFGSSMAMGDANGDGGADLLVGAPYEDVDGNIAQGRAYLFFADRDGDAWPDAQDNCVDTANQDQLDTDLDGLGDACDDDDDNDGLADWYDIPCRTEPEDYDGYQDDDGCPDPDNDMDGICDAGMSSPSCSGEDMGQLVFDPAGTLPSPTVDCRNIAEDYDGFKDSDGCPEPDNDNDGFPDTTDACPGTDALAGADGMLGSPEDLNHNGVQDGAESPLTTDDSPFALSFEDYDGVLDTDGCHDSPGDDYDGDGFTDELEALFLGTNPASACPVTAIRNDEEPDPWPLDLDDNQKVNILDIILLAPPAFGTSPPDPNYSQRKDFNADGKINILDIILLAPPTFGTSCTL